jgi:hypothetical protein
MVVGREMHTIEAILEPATRTELNTLVLLTGKEAV